ncbi:DUF6099 family protein [Wenjunlia vitaminophila]|uniref:DUF6099 family protein n=1 Tax=Wenjunlia vitaminophila TaxID=76728 RepID=UPI00035C836D|nr:DUF6099 family protein [Wenjunlia vitaminophila]
MDVERLIGASRHALAQARGAQGTLAEVWQVQALVEAVGAHLARHGGLAIQAASFALSEAGGRACGAVHQPGFGVGEPRAAALTQVPWPAAALRALRALLDEARVALVVVACAAGEEPAYGLCVEGLDALDECRSRLDDLLRLLEEDAPARVADPPLAQVAAAPVGAWAPRVRDPRC